MIHNFLINLFYCRNQIMAYRYLARNQPVPSQVLMALQGKRPDGTPLSPTPPPSNQYPPPSGQQVGIIKYFKT